MATKYMLLLVYERGLATARLTPKDPSLPRNQNKVWLTPSGEELLGSCPNDCNDPKSRTLFAISLANLRSGVASTTVINSRQGGNEPLEAMAKYFGDETLTPAQLLANALAFLDKELPFFNETEGFLGEFLILVDV